MNEDRTNTERDRRVLALYEQGSYEVVHDLPGGDWRRIVRARGIRTIIVNGAVTFRDNECTGATPGIVLETSKTLVAG